MHARLAEIVRYTDDRRADLEAAALRLPYERWSERPAPESWSVAQVFDHLHVSESRTAALLAKRIARAKEAGLGPERSEESLLHSLDWFPVVDGPKRQAPDFTAPRPDARAPEVHDALRASRADLHAALREGDGLALGDVTATHPALGVINVYQWVLFIGQHEARHTRQVADIVQRLG
ncbi:MAG: DinB family protein [Gemmatimonadaceae bacterium]